jgi:hypothetical protein
MGLYIEESLLNSVKKLLAGRVNELLGEMEDAIPGIEFGQSGCTGLSPAGLYAVIPVLRLSSCERSEKERVIGVEAYSLTISLSVREERDRERYCYAYAGAAAAALGEDPTLGGVVDRAVLTGKKYTPPKHPGTGGDWELILTLRVIIERVNSN